MTIASRADYEAARRHYAMLPRPVICLSTGAGVWQASAKQSNGIDVSGTWPVPTAFGAGGNIPVNGSTGFIKFPTGPSRVLVGSAAFSVSSGSGPGPVRAELIDVAWQASGFVGNVATPQVVVGMPAITRPNANGDKLEMGVIVNTSMGAGTTDVSVSYTNSAGVAGRTASLVIGAFGSWSTANFFMKLRLQAPDVGVQSVQSLTFNTALAAAGDCWLVLYRPITVLGHTDFLRGHNDPFATHFAAIDNNAALTVITQPPATNAASFTGAIELLLD